MIWADRVGTVWMITVVMIVLAVDPTQNSTSGTIVFWTIVAPWLLMRALDWICCGEFRHRFGFH